MEKLLEEKVGIASVFTLHIKTRTSALKLQCDAQHNELLLAFDVRYILEENISTNNSQT